MNTRPTAVLASPTLLPTPTATTRPRPERRDPDPTFGLDIEYSDYVINLAAGRRRVGFISISVSDDPLSPTPIYAMFIYQYDRRHSSTARYVGAVATARAAIEHIAASYRDGIPSWLGQTR